MRLKLVVCKVLQREAYYCAARAKNTVDIVFLPQGLHNEPDKLRSEVQQALTTITDDHDNTYDAILLGYGLCSNGIIGLSAEIPLIVPRGHDCVTLLLGSKELYQQYFQSRRGVYWYSPGWIEHGDQPGKHRYDRLLQEYREKYGQDNAEYLMQTEQNWINEYSWAIYVDWGLLQSQKYKEFTKECAEFLGWKYDEVEGDPGLMQRMVDGQWDDSEFLKVEPGRKIAEDLTCPGIIKSE